ncbi:MAG: ABC transporter ATP-binding protein [Peptococcaceae bacterium]|nr:ABC transporter ATP-binding protein [Peptococcaceae bacterium]
MAVETDELTKIYGDKVGCERICLSVPEGQIFGFLGPNGAGKSTLVKMLVGLVRPTSGSARLLGKPLGSLEARKKIGFLPENFSYHEWMTGRQLLEFHAALYGMSRESRKRRIPLVMDLAGMSAAAGRKVRTYSKGMKQRLGIAVSMLSDPDLLFLDEPTSALDPLGRREVREILLQLKERGKTIFLNSHLLSEVEMICDQVAFIKGGRIIAQGSTVEMQAGSVVVELQVENVSDALMEEIKGISKIIGTGRNTVRAAVGSREEIPRLAEAVVRGGGRLYRLAHEKLSLEEIFVSLLREEDPDC